MENKTNGYVLEMKYPGLGWTGSKDFKVYGHVRDGNGKVLLNFEGKWD